MLESSASSVKDVNKEKNNHFFNFNTVNGFHSLIKKRYDFYRDVATKYLNWYNGLFSVQFKNKEYWMETLMNSLREISSVSRYHTVKNTMTFGLLCI